MTGNVWQWCADGKRGYTKGKCTDPKGPEGSVRVLRGGSWSDIPLFARSAYRLRNVPSRRGFSFGFRVLVRLD
jgi:formylglycine-generating enzyme required for sulfatase activity